MEWKRRLWIAGIVAGVYVGVRYLLPATIPFLFGWLLATWIYPAAMKTEKKLHIKKGIVGTGYLLGILCLLCVVLYKGTLALLSQLKLAVESYHGLEAFGMKTLGRCCNLLENWTGICAKTSEQYVLQQVNHMQRRLLTDLKPSSIVGALSSLHWIVRLFSGITITFLAGMFFLKDMEAIQRGVRKNSNFRGILRITKRLKETVVMYLKAQGVLFLLIGGICCLGFWLMKSPYYLLIGIFLGLMDMLPIIGTGSFLYPAALVFLVQGQTLRAVGCVVLDLVTSFAREFLEPRLLGKKLGIYPVVLLAAVYGGILLYGWSGFLLGPLSLVLTVEIGKERDLWG